MREKKQQNNRMQWILLLEECEKPGKNKTYSTEYEICSEARIPGVIDYGNGSLLCGLLQEKNQNGLYTYSVRVKHVEREYKFDKKNYSKKGYYFENGLIGELIAVFSVYFQTRFYLKAKIIGEFTPNSISTRFESEFQYKKPHPYINFEMLTDQKRNWAYKNGLRLFLDSIRKLDKKYHQSLIRAFYWYSEAVKEIGSDHQLFYIRMVSSVETLLNYIQIIPDELENKLTEIIKNKFTGFEINQIKNWLDVRRIGYKFKTFLEKYSHGFFKGGNKKAKHCYIFKNDLGKYAKRIYDARSKYLHCGEPMYISSDAKMEEAKYWDLDASQGKMADRRRFPENIKLPRVRWFERIVNHCFKNFIKEFTL